MTHAAFLPLLALTPWFQEGGTQDPAAQAARIRGGGEGAVRQFAEELRSQGILLDLARGRAAVEGSVQDPQMPMEYLLVGPKGALHETLFATEARPSRLTTALYLLGLEAGRNVEYREKNPLPSEAEMAEGVLPYEVLPPSGPGVFIYAEWKEGEERRRYRAEDLILNQKTGRTVARSRWVFLGSRWLQPTPKDPRVFAADLEENIVSVCFFASGNQVLTSPDPDGQEQHLFFPNRWLLPPKGTKVSLVFSLSRLEEGD